MKPPPSADRLPPAVSDPSIFWPGSRGDGPKIVAPSRPDFPLNPIGTPQALVLMRKLILLVALVVIALLAAGALWLALWEPEAPREPIEKVVPNERLQS